MGARDGERNITQQQRKKIDDSEGMCGSETSYESFWSRICNPDRSHVLKDVLRGLLVLIVLAIIVTVIFLLCYFLLTDIEKKEDEVIDNLVKAFSEGDQNFQPGMEMTVKNTDSPTDAEVYRTNPNQGNLGQIDHLDIIATTEEVHDNFAPSSSISGNPGENVEIVNPPLFAPDVVEIKVTPRTDEAHSPKPDDGFISVVDYPSVPQGNDLTPSDVFSPETKLDHPNHDYDAYDVINHPTEFVVPEITNECVPLRLPVCSSSVPWSLTAFPNWVNNNNVNELQESLKFFQGTIIESRCSARALQYSCAILEPACGPGGIPLPPCKSFCEDIARTCSEFLTTGNEHNNAFQCNRFPDSIDPNVCVEVNLASPNEPPLISLPMAPTSEHVESVQPEESNTPTTTTSQVVPDLTTESTGVPQEEVIATTELPVFICDNTKFLCEDGSDCLSQDSVCDGVQQCIDNTDELNCTKPEPISTIAPTAPLKRNSEPVEKLSSRRPSLSDMLSGSSLVAVPDPVTEPPPTPKTLKFRFSSPNPSRPKKPRLLDNTSRAKSNSFVSPVKSENHNENQVLQHSKLSLASLLSTSIAPSSQRTLGSHSVSHPTFIARDTIHNDPTDEEPFSTIPQHRGTLSVLLSSATFRASPSTRVEVFECPELKCVDGKCISLRQLNDGVVDCTDGKDEFSQRRS